MPLNVPNILTLIRILAIPLIIWLHINEKFIICGVVLLIAISTDFFDGVLARKLNQETHFGAIFDPIADRIVALSFYGYIGIFGYAPWWFVSILWLRNFSQLMSVPILIWWLKRTFHVKPSKFAKYVTAISDIYIFVPLFMAEFFLENSLLLNMVMILIGSCEFIIFSTYVPRLVAIARGKHDTFT